MSKTSSLSLLEAFDNLSTFSCASSMQDIALCQDFDLEMKGLELHVSSVIGFACDLSQKELEQMVHNTLLVVSDHLKEASKMQKRSAQMQLKVTKTTASMMQLSLEALQNLGQILPAEVGKHLEHSEAMQQVSQLHRKTFGDRKVTALAPLARHVLSEKFRPPIGGIYELGQKELHNVLHHLEYLFEDTLYELYFLQKATGPFWLDQETLHHMQAYEDFHELLSNPNKRDPLYQALCKVYSMKARFIWNESERELEQFLKSNVNSNDYPLSNHLRKAIVALKLAAFMHEEGSELTGEKQSYHYGSDFWLFLREALEDETWKKIAQECRQGEKFARWLPVYELVISWIEASLHFDEAGVTKEALAHVPLSGEPTIEGIWGLEQMSRALDLYVEKKTMGVFKRGLEQIQMWRRYYGFDPHLMGHAPLALKKFALKGRVITPWLMAAPVHQICVEKAKICPEWSMTYVGVNSLKHDKALWVDLHTPTSWLEQSRAEVTHHWAQEEGLHYVAMPLNGVLALNAAQTSEFMNTLKQFIRDPIHHFEFAKYSESLLEGLMLCIWRNFFGMKNRLTSHEARAFADLLSLFLLLKETDESGHQHLISLSKDGLDQSLFVVSGLMMLCKLYQEGKWNKEDLDELMVFLHARPLLFRCRPFLTELVERLCHMLAALEEMAAIYGHEAFVRGVDQCWQSAGGTGCLDLKWNV
jgi:hypothetical protein